MTQIIQDPKTRFEQLVRSTLEFQDEDFILTSDQEYSLVLKHIQDHKYFSNQRVPIELSFRDGVYTWYQKVYEPIMSWVDRLELVNLLPEQSRAQLYFSITTHWHFLKENKKGSIHPKKAVISFAFHNVKNMWAKMYFGKRLIFG